jgi:hypothetical protein
MRHLEEESLDELRQQCREEFSDHERFEDAFDLCVTWMRDHPLKLGVDQYDTDCYRRKCLYAVDWRARNEQRIGSDAVEWSEMASTIIGRLIDLATKPMAVIYE